MNNNTLIIISLIVGFLGLCLAGFSLWMFRSLNILRNKFFLGSNAKDLEAVINELADGLHTLQQNQVILENHLKNLRSDFGLAIQKVGLVKFNPFEGGGGNLSFVIALLDGRNNGMVITSMHGREQNRVYTKQIREAKSEIELTEEELGAIEQANNFHKNFISKTY